MAALSVACADEITDTNCPIHSLSEHEHEKPSMVITVPAVISSVSGSLRARTFVLLPHPVTSITIITKHISSPFSLIMFFLAYK